ncbi:hypothetical protein FFF34_011025 [Inquilinus sp. KBS0705]|nr:hypothetical protein FFF34_011025 [Inquilinus sp. KBS0705]
MKIPVCKVFLLLCAFFPALLFAQSKAPVLSLVSSVDKTIEQIAANPKIDADGALKLLSNWSAYPNVKETGRDYNFYYTDATYGKVPLHVYIPTTYKNTVKNACVMMLHGATGQSKFSDIDSLANSEEDVLFDALKAQNYIVIRPIADERKNFSWVVANSTPNVTFKVLNQILVSLKKVLNIDDNRVYAFGHSDGADGALGLGVYIPDAFAGIVAYNSMLENLFARDFYIRNIQNRPFYVVHSDLDDLRPIQQARIIIDSLKTIDQNVFYKEYIGYQHFDKHLDKDVPLACIFMKGIKRTLFHSSVYWEAQRSDIYNSCDWLKLITIDTATKAANWHVPFTTKAYDKRHKTWLENRVQYGYVKKGAAVKASYRDNTFTLQTSRVGEVELLISPIMVDLEKPVIVIANGKQVFSGKVKADKNYLLNNFKKTIDRHTLWVNAIKVKVD